MKEKTFSLQCSLNMSLICLITCSFDYILRKIKKIEDIKVTFVPYLKDCHLLKKSVLFV